MELLVPATVPQLLLFQQFQDNLRKNQSRGHCHSFYSTCQILLWLCFQKLSSDNRQERTKIKISSSYRDLGLMASFNPDTCDFHPPCPYPESLFVTKNSFQNWRGKRIQNTQTRSRWSSNLHNYRKPLTSCLLSFDNRLARVRETSYCSKKPWNLDMTQVYFLLISHSVAG